jgi:hypothetical protein
MSADAVRLTLPQSRFRLRFPSLARRRVERAPVAAEEKPLDLADLLAPGRWAPRHRVDPELRKALGVIQTRLSETRRLLALRKTDVTLRNAAAVTELVSLVRRDPATLDIDGAWELAGALKRLNLRFADREFLTSRLEYEQRRAAATGQWHGWNTHFEAQELIDLLAAFRARQATENDHRRAVDRLTFLYLQREEAGRDRRARAALKRLYLSRLWVVLLLLLAGFGVAINVATTWDIWEAVVLTICAGGLGSTLSGIFKVRDQLVQLDELRSFWPAMRVQPLIGACGGLILFLALRSNAVSLGSVSHGLSGMGLAAFAAGFSEPFFIGTVQRVAVVPDKPAAPASVEETGRLAT